MKSLFGNELLKESMGLLNSVKERIWICSPYVGSLKFILEVSNGKILDKNIESRFITDIKELSNLNIDFFELLKETGELRTLNGVHAKIYIVDNKCLITSANLTETAFAKRYEVGILLNEQESKDTIEIFEAFWKKSIKVKNLKAPYKTNTTPSQLDEKHGFNLPKLWNVSTDKEHPQIWLKPIGVTEYPITEERKFSNTEDELHFAVNPKAIKVNDILIAYGIGAKRILTVYKVKTLGKKFKDDDITEDWMERWSYYLRGENLTPYFGEKWMKRNLYASDLVREYLENNPDGFITANKNKGLGALNYRKDKIKLDSNFAGFILNKIEE
eukprot:TRINITY_DN775809_c0_g1_i1.p1 TRINITY_DN775809_c0_g1~~TRINITY_DN775809_c0_g1_i1.p1  ORF type:complete len:329 (+),score=46.87 TRINITY_DN775809_c0_g1_i1:1836-2822(+)